MSNETKESRWDKVPTGMMLTIPPFRSLANGSEPCLIPMPLSKKERKLRDRAERMSNGKTK